MRRNVVIVALLSLILGVAPAVRGSGFLIYEHGAAAMAMGGAFVAVANNPTAIFHNPAGLAWLEGTQLSLGTTLIVPNSSVRLPYWPNPLYRDKEIKQEDQLFYPPNFYLTHKFSDRVTAGLGVFVPYGLGVKWPKDYPLRYLSVSNDMKTFFFNPAIAVKVTDKLAVGFGVSYIYSTITFNLVQSVQVHPAYPNFDVPTKLEGNGNGFGFNAGVLYKGDGFSLGFNYRSRFNIKYEGDMTLDISGVPAPFQPYIPTKGEGETTFKYPDILGVGAAFNLTDKLLLSLDVHYFVWSRYDQYTLEVTFPSPYPSPEDEVFLENWKDSFIFRGGLQYQLNEKLALRVGALYDQSPQPVESMDPNLPDANRLALTAGIGYKMGHIAIDAAYQYENFAERTSPNRNAFYSAALRTNFGQGIYNTKAHLFGISLSYLF